MNIVLRRNGRIEVNDTLVGRYTRLTNGGYEFTVKGRRYSQHYKRDIRKTVASELEGVNEARP